MIGNIYCRQKCSLCGRKMLHDEKRRGFFCSEHPEIRAHRQYYVKFGRDIRKGFNNYDTAVRFLTGLRFKHDEGTLYYRDYRADNPMAFDKLVDAYLTEKSQLKSFSNLKNYMFKAVEAWGSINVKGIRKRDIKLFLKSLDVSDKTRHNYRSALHDFFTRYLVEEDIIKRSQIPEFPQVSFELGYRKITDWDTQNEIMSELYRLTWDLNPKIYVAVDLLRTYTTLRPGDLLRLTEADVDVKNGILMVWRPTKRKNKRKTVRLVPDHIEMLSEIKDRFKALPSMPFFRHHTGLSGVAAGQPFGNKYLYKWWKKACLKLGIKDLDLYGGTRHTTTTELAKVAGEDAAKDATGHETNKAFERYCQMQGERAYDMSIMVRRHHGGTTKMVPFKNIKD